MNHSQNMFYPILLYIGRYLRMWKAGIQKCRCDMQPVCQWYVFTGTLRPRYLLKYTGMSPNVVR